MVAIVTDPSTFEKKNKSKKKHKHHYSSSSSKQNGFDKVVVEHIDRGMDHGLVDENSSKKKKKHKDDNNVQRHNEGKKKKKKEKVKVVVGHIDRGMDHGLVDENSSKKKKKQKDDNNVQRDNEGKKKKEKVKLVEDNHTGAFISSQLETVDKRKNEDVVSVESRPIQRNKSKEKHILIQKMKDSELVENASTKDATDDGVEEEAGKGKKRKADNNETVERNKSKKKHKAASLQSPVLDNNSAASDNKGEKKMSKVANKKSKKKVSFSDKNDVFILPPNSDEEDNLVRGKRLTKKEDNLVRGKRFTKEEDEILKLAVLHYVDKLNLGDEGLDMVLNCKKHKALNGCWREIGSQIPYRPYLACYYRAQVLFRRAETRKWTQEEYDFILKQQAEHGNNWKDMAEELGKHRWHVKDTWRRIHVRAKKGHWSQQEYQNLFDLVNKDLQAKVLEEKHSKHGMLRDNIPWTSISENVSTRNQVSCCIKWYNELTSPMVTEGVWADVDDYVLISALYSLDANCIEDVDWDGILENRSGDLCRKRWNQMVHHIGHHGNKSFSEQVEVLAQRYCPHLLEAREAWDNKPLVNP